MAVSTATLRMIMKAEDKASGTIGKIGGSIGGLATKIGVGLVAAAGAGAAAIAAFGVKAIQAGGDAFEAISKAQTVFGEFYDQAAADLGKFSDEVGRNKYELLEQAAALQDTFVPLGFARDEAAKYSTELVKLGTDIASFNNQPTAEVLRDIQSAIVGNTETVRKYGIVINQASIEQKALEMGLLTSEANAVDLEKAQLALEAAQAKYNEVLKEHSKDSLEARQAMNSIEQAQQGLAKVMEGTTGELDAQAKAAVIMQMIVEGSSDAMGDAARTADSWANQMVRLRSKFQETVTEIGLKLLPVVTPLLQKFNAMAADVLPKVVEWVGNKLVPVLQNGVAWFDNIENIIKLLATGDFTGGIFGLNEDHPFISFLLSAREKVIQFKDRILEFVERVKEVGLKEALLELLPPEWQEKIDGIWTSIDNFINKIKEKWPQIKDEGQSVVDWFETNFQINTLASLDNVSSSIDSLSTLWEQHGDTIIAVMGFVIKFLITTVFGGIQLLTGLIAGVLKMLTGDWQGGWDEMQATVELFAENVLNLFGTNLKTVRETWEGVFYLLYEIVKITWERAKIPFIMAKIFIQSVMEQIRQAIADKLNIALGVINKLLTPIDDLKRKLGELKDKFMNLDLPDWLTPGSPTPLENGLVGISKAAEQVKKSTKNLVQAEDGTWVPKSYYNKTSYGQSTQITRTPAASAASSGMALSSGTASGSGGGGNVTVNIYHQPAVSLFDESEARTKLKPLLEGIVRDIVRKYLRE